MDELGIPWGKAAKFICVPCLSQEICDLITLGQSDGFSSCIIRWEPTHHDVVFGFIHGLGFAGAINEIFLPKEDMLKILFAFNLGIEVGQILIFGIFALFAYFLEFYNLSKLRDFATFAITASIFGYSLNLIIERSFIVF